MYDKARWIAWACVAWVSMGCDKSSTAADATQPPTSAATAAAEAERLRYPQTQRVDHVDVYHGVKVADPYRWLEDIDGEATRAWIEAQNELTFGYLDRIEERDAIRKRLTELWNFERWGVPSRHGERYVVQRNDGLQDQSVLYTLGALDASPKVLLDPNALSPDGTVALAGTAFSHDGEAMAYGVSDAGSDWEVWKIRDVATGKDHDDEIRWVKFSRPSWTRDGKGFYYSRYDAPKPGNAMAEVNEDQKLFYHRLGQPQADDTLVYARPDRPKWGFDGDVTEDGRYLVITVKVGTDPKTSVLYQDLRSPKRHTVELLTGFDARHVFVGNDKTKFWFLTDADAPRAKLVAIDIRKPKKRVEVIAQSEQTLRNVSLVGDRFFANYLDNARSRVAVFGLDGKHERDIELPGLGTVSGLSGKREHTETFFGYTSFATPTAIYRYDIASGESVVFRRPDVAFDPDDYVTEQVFYESADKTRIPMFVSYKKGLQRDAAAPTYLYGYGGFNIPLTPSFSVPNLVWMELGGVFAMPNLRGGGEFGEAWHLAGTKLVKQNVFDDFIAAAQWLIDNDYTRAERLAIGGRSNGGLLVGAAMTQRPDLFGAALPGVGVMDMLRFNQFTIGWAWESDYGSPQNQAEFAALRAYSPYHNLEDGTDYPATMVYTADHDDRVVPAHSYKFAAALQHAHDGPDPVLIRIDTRAGHGAGKPTSKKIEEWTDLWGFLVDALKVDISGTLG